MAHIGLTPQSVSSPDGYRVQGRDDEAAKKLMDDAKAVETAGAFCVVVEAVPESLATAITAQSNIPTIGIGASASCDGQILVTEDMLGITLGKPPKFVKQYATLSDTISTAVKQYAEDVKNRAFPAMENTYKDNKNKAA
jgi:3-methyl-2-oxobutanoate hydroxymethyltransferase